MCRLVKRYHVFAACREPRSLSVQHLSSICTSAFPPRYLSCLVPVKTRSGNQAAGLALCCGPTLEEKKQQRVRGHLHKRHLLLGRNAARSRSEFVMSRSQRSRCAVAGCESDSTVRIHRVPEDPERRHAWLRRIGWPASKQRARIFVCERHFSPEDYTTHAGVMQAMGFDTRRLQLNKDAVPSLFLPSIQPHAMDAQSSQGDTTSVASSSTHMDVPPATVCQCSCHHRARASVATQCSLGMKAARDIGVQAHLDVKLHITKATQTEPCSPQLQNDFELPRQSTPVLPDEEMVVDEEVVDESDTSYHESFDYSISSEPAEEPPHQQRKFLVFENNLRELLTFCQVCHRHCKNEWKVVGSMLYVTSSCPHHTWTWQSQPLVGNKPAGNVLLAAAILFSGCTVATFLRALKSINMQTIHERTFFNYQRGYLLPAIKKLFQEWQA